MKEADPNRDQYESIVISGKDIMPMLTRPITPRINADGFCRNGAIFAHERMNVTPINGCE